MFYIYLFLMIFVIALFSKFFIKIGEFFIGIIVILILLYLFTPIFDNFNFKDVENLIEKNKENIEIYDI